MRLDFKERVSTPEEYNQIKRWINAHHHGEGS